MDRLSPESANKEYVLIIGGVGCLGSVLIPKLKDAGFQVILGDVIARGNRDCVPIEHHGCSLYHLDATRPKSIKEFRKKIEERGIGLSHIVNTVGGLVERGVADIFKTSAREITQTVRLNLLAQIYPVRYLGQHLKKTPSANKSITLISSINAIAGYSIPFYSAAKSGISGFIRPVALELGQSGIRINSVMPGTVMTPSTVKQPKNFKIRAESAALQRLCSPDEVADGIMACIAMTGMTGQELVVDAGQSINPSASLYDQTRRGEVPGRASLIRLTK